jgi:tetratricopeptide (TPR) repeat protein
LDKRATVWTITPCNYPVEDIAELAELLRGARLRAGATPQPLRPSELAERFQRSRARHPEAFATTAAELANWHERLSEVAQAAHRWPSVVAHIDAALSADPKLADRPTADLIFTRRAQALAELGQFVEATTDLERAVQQDRGRFGTRQLLAHMSLVGGLAPQLSAACIAAVQDFAWAANDKSIFSSSWKFGVAWMCTLLPSTVSDLNGPLRFSDSMVEQAPHEFDALAKHGGLLYRAGRFKEASCEIDRHLRSTRIGMIGTILSCWQWPTAAPATHRPRSAPMKEPWKAGNATWPNPLPRFNGETLDFSTPWRPKRKLRLRQDR